jgi:NADP-dependent aldehyde dehydrogenase
MHALHGQHLLGGGIALEAHRSFTAVDPTTGARLEPTFTDATPTIVERAVALAASAAVELRSVARERRAALLERIAERIEAVGPELTARATLETGLPAARLESERGRTCGQLRLFARVIRDGACFDLRLDRADPQRTPIPKPELRSMMVPIGPVAVFGASNFPLAFSVAGGDTASALAAGCPVIVKAHPAHPGTSEIAARAIAAAIADREFPAGTFALLQGSGHEVGQRLVESDGVRAVAFTGSLRGGRALMDVAAARKHPIPVFAEMGSTNPVFVLSGKIAADVPAGYALAKQIAGSVTLGCGQFCTNPGLVFVVDDPAATAWTEQLAAAMRTMPRAVMLHAGIAQGFRQRLAEVQAVAGVRTLAASSEDGATSCSAGPVLLSTTAEDWLANASLREEVFGPATIVVRCRSPQVMLECARRLDGQLSATVLGEVEDRSLAHALADGLVDRVGRLLFLGMPTGVEVNDSIVHGGPYPATSQPSTTSVGSRAITRFLRPVAWQDCPGELLPLELHDEELTRSWRRVDGVLYPPGPEAR